MENLLFQNNNGWAGAQNGDQPQARTPTTYDRHKSHCQYSAGFAEAVFLAVNNNTVDNSFKLFVNIWNKVENIDKKQRKEV